MDSVLQARLDEWEAAVEDLKEFEEVYFLSVDQEKPLFSALYLEAKGRTVSDREAMAFCHDSWIEYKKEHVKLKVNYNLKVRLFELRKKRYEAEYASLKRETDLIKRQI